MAIYDPRDIPGDPDFHEVGCGCEGCQLRVAENEADAKALKPRSLLEDLPWEPADSRSPLRYERAERLVYPPIVVDDDGTPLRTLGPHSKPCLPVEPPRPSRPLVVVGSKLNWLKASEENPGRSYVVWVVGVDQIVSMADFDFVVYRERKITAVEAMEKARLVDALRRRPGARQISVEEAEGRVQRREGMKHVCEAGRDARMAELPDGRVVVASPDHPPKVIDHHRGTVDGVPRKDMLDKVARGLGYRDADHLMEPVDVLQDLPFVEADLDAFADEALRVIRALNPTTTIPRIERGRRADVTVPARVHETAHNLGPNLESGADHRMGWKPGD